MKKIKQIEFKNFRAYNQYKFDINTDKNIVLLYGNNGFGKTSFFDGIEWGFTGKLERYSGSAKEKNEYSILKNNLSSATEKGYVNIQLDDNFCIKREIRSTNVSDYNDGNLNLKIDALNNMVVKEEFKEKVDFYDSFNFSHLLSQELLSNFIRGTKDTDRYKTIVKLFGLERYEKFNPHLRIMKDKVEERLSLITERLKTIKNKIEIEKVKLSKLEIDPKTKIKEMKILLDVADAKSENEMDVNELEKILTNSHKEKIELEKKLQITNRSIDELDYFHENFDEKEKINKILIEKKKLSQGCDDSIQLLEYYGALNYIHNNLTVYNDYIINREEYNDILAKFEKIQSDLLLNPLFTNAQFDEQLSYIKELGIEYKTIIDQYDLARKNKYEIDQEIAGLEMQLSEKYGLEKKLLNTAQDFLKENLNLRSCPVCQNEFNLNETLKQLEERLMDEYSVLFKELINEIEHKKTLASQKKVLIEGIETEIKDNVIKVKNSILTKKNEYHAQVKAINEKNEVVNKILSKAALHKISIDKVFINDQYIKMGNIIETSKLNMDIKYHQLLKQELDEDINSLENEIKKYLNIRKNHSVGSLSEAEILLKQKRDDSFKIKELVTKYTKVILIANELEEYIKNKTTKELVEELTREKIMLENDFEALYVIKNDYEDILKAVRKVVESETRNALDKYLKNIRKVYSYLNPHLYLNSFDIKIDDKNPSNNRLVFEVFNDKNKKVNPSYIFSSAQNNVLALSIFFSFAFFQDWSNLNFVCLDDPIQNMDDINIFNFIDIIRALIRETDKQIFISTHDDRVYNFMLKKFRHNVQAFKFTEYGVAVEDTGNL